MEEKKENNKTPKKEDITEKDNNLSDNTLKVFVVDNFKNVEKLL